MREKTKSSKSLAQKRHSSSLRSKCNLNHCTVAPLSFWAQNIWSCTLFFKFELCLFGSENLFCGSLFLCWIMFRFFSQFLESSVFLVNSARKCVNILLWMLKKPYFSQGSWQKRITLFPKHAFLYEKNERKMTNTNYKCLIQLYFTSNIIWLNYFKKPNSMEIALEISQTNRIRKLIQITKTICIRLLKCW